MLVVLASSVEEYLNSLSFLEQADIRYEPADLSDVRATWADISKAVGPPGMVAADVVESGPGPHLGLV